MTSGPFRAPVFQQTAGEAGLDGQRVHGCGDVGEPVVADAPLVIEWGLLLAWPGSLGGGRGNGVAYLPNAHPLRRRMPRLCYLDGIVVWINTRTTSRRTSTPDTAGTRYGWRSGP